MVTKNRQFHTLTYTTSPQLLCKAHMKHLLPFLLVMILVFMQNVSAQEAPSCHHTAPNCQATLSQDLKILQEIVSLNGLTVSAQDLGLQVWEKGRLTWLALGEDDLQIHLLPENIGQLDGLTHLYLSGNHLKQLPASIGKLRKLEALYLNDNALTQLPESIGELVKLEQLYLNGNRLTTIPASIANMAALRNLYLNGNQIQSIPEEVAQLPALRNLYF